MAFATLRVALVSCVLLVALIVYTALLVSPTTAAEWTGNSVHLDGGVLHSAQLKLATLLAAVAGVAFAAAALADGPARDRFLGDEPDRISRALELAALHQAATAAHAWPAAEPGWTWSSWDAFVAEDDRRCFEQTERLILWPVKFRTFAHPLVQRRLTLQWLGGTGELVARSGPDDATEMLTICHEPDRVHDLIRTWSRDDVRATGTGLKRIRREARQLPLGDL